MGTHAQQQWNPERPDQQTAERPSAAPRFCGKRSPTLIERGIMHMTCSREPGHPGFCYFEALTEADLCPRR